MGKSFLFHPRCLWHVSHWAFTFLVFFIYSGFMTWMSSPVPLLFWQVYQIDSLSSISIASPIDVFFLLSEWDWLLISPSQGCHNCPVKPFENHSPAHVPEDDLTAATGPSKRKRGPGAAHLRSGENAGQDSKSRIAAWRKNEQWMLKFAELKTPLFYTLHINLDRITRPAGVRYQKRYDYQKVAGKTLRSFSSLTKNLNYVKIFYFQHNI